MGITTAPATRALPLACLMLLLLRRAPGEWGPPRAPAPFPRHTPPRRWQGNPSPCPLASGALPSLPPFQLAFIPSQRTGSFPRVTRVVSGSNTDFSIRISDVRPEDAGTYYCVKFIKSVVGEEEFRRGKGTEVSVRGSCGPSSPGTSVPPWQTPLPAALGLGFFPREISVKWLKDNIPISAQQPQITPGWTKSSYNMSSSVTMTLQEDDVRAQLVCEVQHSTLPAPLRGSYRLSRTLRGEGCGGTRARGVLLPRGWGSWGGDGAPCGWRSWGMSGTRSCFSSQFPPVSAWSVTRRAPLR
uniref:Immunoglobulin C1-set domain-containing protein n=1 Tax=Strix occidentalis caurina TaxID=311401 RepID=A0A8D0FLQ1_STROC